MITENAQIAARIILGNDHDSFVRDLSWMKHDQLQGARLMAPFGSDDDYFFGWLCEAVRALKVESGGKGMVL